MELYWEHSYNVFHRFNFENGKGNSMRIIVIGAHPDDCEYYAAGTAVKWVTAGHQVKFVSVTSGDAGHQSLRGEELARIRRAETERADAILGVECEILENHDGLLTPEIRIREDLSRIIRRWEADMVISHRPWDYHPDHRATGVLVQDTAYLVLVPGICPDTPSLKQNPVYLYLQDTFQTPVPFRPDVIVPIDDVWERKVAALHEMTSQMYEWLPWSMNSIDKVPRGEKERIRWLDELLHEWLRNHFPAETTQRFGWNVVKIIEAFQVCEYGRQPSSEELRKMFFFPDAHNIV
jgi:LmbE family N-acetylglucosaminyl deacetylase